MKRFLIIVTVLGMVAALGAGFTSSTSAATQHSPQSVKVLIQHKMHGCHVWSVNGGSLGVSRSVHVATGGSATFINNDVMPHKLVLTGGPAVKFVGNASMSHMMGHTGASVKVIFTKAGTYHFMTKAGEDYKGVTLKTTGEDNVLRLTATVS